MLKFDFFSLKDSFVSLVSKPSVYSRDILVLTFFVLFLKLYYNRIVILRLHQNIFLQNELFFEINLMVWITDYASEIYRFNFIYYTFAFREQ